MLKFIGSLLGSKEPPEIQNHEENTEDQVKQRLDFMLSVLESDFCNVESKTSSETQNFIRTNILKGPMKSKALG